MISKKMSDLASGDRIVDMVRPALNPIARNWEKRIMNSTVLGTIELPFGYTRVYLVADELPMVFHSSHKVIVDNSTLHYSEV